jgi:hypothetical protein
MRCLYLFLFILLGVQVESQEINANISTANVLKNANTMKQAFLQENLSEFIKWNYPPLVALMGGAKKMEYNLHRAFSDMKMKGVKILEISFGDVSRIIKNGQEYQCTFQQVTEVGHPNGKLQKKSTLIAISGDSGNSWTFIDTNNKSIDELRSAMPNLSNKIALPK